MVVINITKSVFTCPSLELLGHQVTTAGVVPRHVDAIQDFPQPPDIKQLQLNLTDAFIQVLLAPFNH